jgi:hypothetical protein
MTKILATSFDLSSLSVVAPPEAAPVKSRLHVWAPVPGLSTGGLVQPLAIDLGTQASSTLALEAVELRYKILLLHDAAHVAGEYFLIENRFPGAPLRNYDGPLGAGAVVIWQIYEDRQLVNSSVICPGDPRFIRMRKVLRTPAESEVLTWAGGSPVGFLVSAPIPDGELAQISLQKV